MKKASFLHNLQTLQITRLQWVFKGVVGLRDEPVPWVNYSLWTATLKIGPYAVVNAFRSWSQLEESEFENIVNGANI